MEVVTSDPAVARFEALVAQVHQPVLRFLLRRSTREAAPDVLADTLLVMWRRLDDVPDGAELPWAYAVARRCLANHERGALRHRQLMTRLTIMAPTTEAVATGSTDADADLTDAMSQLSEADQEVLRLWAWEDLELREIAVALGITTNAATVRFHRAKKRLAALLKEPHGIRTQTGQRKEI